MSDTTPFHSSASHASRVLRIRRQHTEIKTLIFEVKSLEVVPTLLLSTEPRNARSLKSEEVSAFHHLLLSNDQSGASNTRISKYAVEDAIYIGRARKNRRVGRPFTDEPCLYLVFPHLSEGYGLLLRQFQQLVILQIGRAHV